MAIGFMRCTAVFRIPDCKGLTLGVLSALNVLALLPAVSLAAEISLIGVFPGRGAVVVVDASPPQSMRIGQKLGGVTLISVDKASAVLDDGGRRRTVGLGQHVTSAGAQPDASAQQVTLTADNRGQFLANSTVNGGAMRFMVDTGATLVSIPGNDARRLGINFAKAPRSVAQTANGPAPVYQVKLDSIKVGDIELMNVDALVLDGGGLTQPLLGMSFLNRVEMRREGDSMTLKRRF